MGLPVASASGTELGLTPREFDTGLRETGGPWPFLDHLGIKSCRVMGYAPRAATQTMKLSPSSSGSSTGST